MHGGRSEEEEEQTTAGAAWDGLEIGEMPAGDDQTLRGGIDWQAAGRDDGDDSSKNWFRLVTSVVTRSFITVISDLGSSQCGDGASRPARLAAGQSVGGVLGR
ncbi:hypothetical protein Aduo_002407 [Ancylostoma duodenale]